MRAGVTLVVVAVAAAWSAPGRAEPARSIGGVPFLPEPPSRDPWPPSPAAPAPPAPPAPSPCAAPVAPSATCDPVATVEAPARSPVPPRSPRSTRDRNPPWYRSFYAQVGWRDVYGVASSRCRFDGWPRRSGPGCLHAWATLSYGLGYRFERGAWGLDATVLSFQRNPVEGLHTAAKLVGYVQVRDGPLSGLWGAMGASYGWTKGVVDAAIAKRKGHGVQTEALVGYDLPTWLGVRTFVHAAITTPLYVLYDTYHSSDSTVYVFGVEAALGVRF